MTDDPWGDRQLGIAPADFTRMIAAGALFAQPPGIAFEYSNLGFALLGRVITNVTGKRYQDYIAQALLRPLGMSATTFDFFAVHEAQARDRLSLGARALVAGSGGAGRRVRRHGRARHHRHGLCALRRLPAVRLAAARRRGDRPGAPRHRARAGTFARPAAARRLRATAKGKTVAVASGYGYGMVSSIDPVLGRTLHHRGGLPGYGSHVLIAPDTGIGLFTFANVTYFEADAANLAAAQALHDAGLWQAARSAASRERWPKRWLPSCAPMRRDGSTRRRRCSR